MPHKLYGIGRRGVAIHPPNTGLNVLDSPIPLWHDIKVPERIIEERGPSGGAQWHIIEFEVRDGS